MIWLFWTLASAYLAVTAGMLIARAVKVCLHYKDRDFPWFDPICFCWPAYLWRAL